MKVCGVATLLLSQSSLHIIAMVCCTSDLFAAGQDRPLQPASHLSMQIETTLATTGITHKVRVVVVILTVEGLCERVSCTL